MATSAGGGVEELTGSGTGGEQLAGGTSNIIPHGRQASVYLCCNSVTPRRE